jgi:hypothetical protein
VCSSGLLERHQQRKQPREGGWALHQLHSTSPLCTSARARGTRAVMPRRRAVACSSSAVVGLSKSIRAFRIYSFSSRRSGLPLTTQTRIRVIELFYSKKRRLYFFGPLFIYIHNTFMPIVFSLFCPFINIYCTQLFTNHEGIPCCG